MDYQSNQSSEPDFIKLIVNNCGDEPIKDANLYVAAWGENGLPVYLQYKNSKGETMGDYCIRLGYSGIALAPYESIGWGNNGWSIEHASRPIAALEACIVSHTTYDGVVHTNPYCSAWKEMFAGNPYPGWDTTVRVYVRDRDSGQSTQSGSITDHLAFSPTNKNTGIS